MKNDNKTLTAEEYELRWERAVRRLEHEESLERESRSACDSEEDFSEENEVLARCAHKDDTILRSMAQGFYEPKPKCHRHCFTKAQESDRI